MESKSKFYKEDLVWEAARRNEEFKKDVREFHSKHKSGTDDHLSLEDELNMVDDEIRIKKKWHLAFIPENIDITADQIKNRTNNKKGDELLSIHPYYQLYFHEDHPVIHHENISDILDVLDTGIFNSKMEKEIIKKKRTTIAESISWGICKSSKDAMGGKKGVKRIPINRLKMNDFHKFTVASKNCVVLTIEPSVDYDKIRDDIIKILNRVRNKMKDKSNIKSNKIYNPSEIASYIECLNLYDGFVEALKEKILNGEIKESDLIILNGAYLKPKELNYNDLVDTALVIKKTEELIKMYIDQIVIEILKRNSFSYTAKPPQRERRPKDFATKKEKIIKMETITDILETISCDEFEKYSSKKLKQDFFDSIIEILKNDNGFQNIKSVFDANNIVRESIVYESERKNIGIKIQKAIKLIQSAPNINFGNARTEKII